MCQCTPNIRTPWCGKGDCVQPGTKPDGARDIEAHQYPPDELVIKWVSDWDNATDSFLDRAPVHLRHHIARQACEWQKDQILNAVYKDLKGCTNHGCVIRPPEPGTMGTNSICQCHKHPDGQRVLHRLAAIRGGGNG